MSITKDDYDSTVSDDSLDNRSADTDLTITTAEDGYTRIFAECPDGSVDSAYIHQLVACLDHDPHDVFASDTHCHHRLGVLVETGGGIDVLPAEAHLARHRDGYEPPAVDAVLERRE